MAQSAVGFGLAPQIKGLGGGVDRRWVAVGEGKNNVGQRKRYKAIQAVLHSGRLRGLPALRCANQNQRGWPREETPRREEEQRSPDAEDEDQVDAQRTSKAPLADPPPPHAGSYFPQQTGYPPYINQSGNYPCSAYPPQQYPPQQLYPNVGYYPPYPHPQQYPPQQLYPQYHYPGVGYAQYHNPSQVQYLPQQPYPPPPRQPTRPTIADLAALLNAVANAQDIFNGF